MQTTPLALLIEQTRAMLVPGQKHYACADNGSRKVYAQICDTWNSAKAKPRIDVYDLTGAKPRKMAKAEWSAEL
jgi:hypothetical protein